MPTTKPLQITRRGFVCCLKFVVLNSYL